MSSPKIIYSKRFKKDWLKNTDESKKKYTRDEVNEARRKVDNLEKLFKEKSEYIKIPRSQIVFKSYIDFSKKLSDELEIDMDIIQQTDHYKIIMYWESGLIIRDYKNLLSFMLMFCDEAYISTPGNLAPYYEFTIEFMLYTHELYVDGNHTGLHKPLV